jgi:hypothetical protein
MKQFGRLLITLLVTASCLSVAVAQMPQSGMAAANSDMDVKSEAPEGSDDKTCCVCFEQQVVKGTGVRHDCNGVDFSKVCDPGRRFSCFYDKGQVYCLRFDSNGKPIVSSQPLPEVAQDLSCSQNFVVVNIGRPNAGYLPQDEQIYCGTTKCREWALASGKDPKIVCVAGAGASGSPDEKKYICDLTANFMKQGNWPKSELHFEFALAPVQTAGICIDIKDGKPTGNMGGNTLKITIFPDGTLEAQECSGNKCSFTMDYSKFKKTYCTAPAVGQPAQGTPTQSGTPTAGAVVGAAPPTGSSVRILVFDGQSCPHCITLKAKLNSASVPYGARPPSLKEIRDFNITSIPYTLLIRDEKVVRQVIGDESQQIINWYNGQKK